MSIEEENKALAHKVFEEFNNMERDPESLNKWVDKYFAPEVVYHTPTGDMNREQYKSFIAVWSAAFPDAVFTLKDVVAEDDKVVTYYSMQGTHKDEYMGIKPSGKQIKVMGIYLDHISGGKVIDSLGMQDTFGFMKQIGAILSR